MLRPLPKRLGRLLSRTMSHRETDPRAAGKRVLVAGLGNYGLRGTRHNVGMAVLNHLAQKLNVAAQWKVDRRCCADVTIANVEEAELVLMKPRRLMNINGLSVASAAETYDLGVEDIYLVHDDLDKPLGKMAIKLGGSASAWCGSGLASAGRWGKPWWIATCWAGSPALSTRSCSASWSRRPTSCWNTSCRGAAARTTRPLATRGTGHLLNPRSWGSFYEYGADGKQWSWTPSWASGHSCRGGLGELSREH
ncbi:peptidyl-tRNA hydrolase isoform X5 [Chrysemys picta bellii]|uniref:peptidyl-tRNA hydrolase isoform X5 n=1 Tax=Chrysemys picta bellii TaxID=8478 RepID=UPI0032B1B668